MQKHSTINIVWTKSKAFFWRVLSRNHIEKVVIVFAITKFMFYETITLWTFCLCFKSLALFSFSQDCIISSLMSAFIGLLGWRDFYWRRKHVIVYVICRDTISSIKSTCFDLNCSICLICSDQGKFFAIFILNTKLVAFIWIVRFIIKLW